MSVVSPALPTIHVSVSDIMQMPGKSNHVGRIGILHLGPNRVERGLEPMSGY